MARTGPAMAAAAAKAEPLSASLLGQPAKGTSVLLTVATAVKTVLGSGILTISWSFYLSTMWPGVVVTLVMCLMSAHSFFNIGLCSEISGQDTYSQIWVKLCGGRYAWLPDVVTSVFCIISAISYWIVIGDYLPRGVEGLGLDCAWLQGRRAAILVIALALLPLNFLRDLGFLGYTSLIGTIGSLYTVAVLCVEAADLPPADWKSFDLQPALFTTIPAVAFAFNGHFTVPSLYRGLHATSSERWLLVTVLAFGLCCLLNMASAVSGYVMLGSQLAAPGRSNVLMAPALQSKPEVMVAYLTTMASVALGIPIYIKGARDGVDAIWTRNGSSLSDARRSFVLSAALVALTLAVAMAVSDLGVMNALNGAVCASLMMFVLPAVMYLKCGTSALNRRLSMGSAVLGVLVGALGVASSLSTAMGG